MPREQRPTASSDAIPFPDPFFFNPPLPSPPPISLPAYDFPEVTLVSGGDVMVQEPSSIDEESGSISPRSTRTISRKINPTNLTLETNITRRLSQQRIIVPGIVLTPPHSPSLRILDAHYVDDPFSSARWPRRPRSSRPSLMSFTPFSTQSVRTLTTPFPRLVIDPSDLGYEQESRPTRFQRSFSLPHSINTALDWAFSPSPSVPSSPTKLNQSSRKISELAKRRSQPLGGITLPPFSDPSKIFSPDLTSDSSIRKTSAGAVPPYSPRRRVIPRSPFIFLCLPVMIIALHLYLSLVDVRWMYRGHNLVFGNPSAVRMDYAAGVKIDMNEAWSIFEERASLVKRSTQNIEESSIWLLEDIDDDESEDSLAEPEDELEENDVVAFLRSIQETALKALAKH